MLQVGPLSLHYYCAIVLHCCIVLPPVGNSSNHEYHCCQLTRQSSCVSNFYYTFKVFIWLSLIHIASQLRICQELPSSSENALTTVNFQNAIPRARTFVPPIRGRTKFYINSVIDLSQNYNRWPASWSSGQRFWLLIMRSRVRFPALSWEFFPI
jgi:hypothetical protein